MYKKLIFLIGATILTTTTTFSVVSCQAQNSDGGEKPEIPSYDPFEIPKVPKDMGEVYTLVGDYCDLTWDYYGKWTRKDNIGRILVHKITQD